MEFYSGFFFLKMAIQYAFYRIHKTPGAHYESGSTRMFQRGRTEVIRSCSNESINFAKAMMNKSLDKGLCYIWPFIIIRVTLKSAWVKHVTLC